MLTFLLFAMLAYGAGSINFAILFFRLFKKGDPRDRYSGNPGVTNVYRQSGWAMAALILLLDMGRSAAIAWLALRFFTPPLVVWSGLALLTGNRYPCFHDFKGGKGVANYLGFSIIIVPMGVMVSCLAWVVTYRLLRHPFMASFFMVAVLSGATILKWADSPWAVSGAVVTALFIVINHRSNIAGLFTSAD